MDVGAINPINFVENSIKNPGERGPYPHPTLKIFLASVISLQVRKNFHEIVLIFIKSPGGQVLPTAYCLLPIAPSFASLLRRMHAPESLVLAQTLLGFEGRRLRRARTAYCY